MTTEKKGSENSADENWEFELESSPVESIVTTPEVKKTKKSFKSDEQKLKVDYKAKPKMATREEMYNSLEKKSPVEEDDILNFAPINKRISAYLIDQICNLVFLAISYISAPIIHNFCDYYNEKKHLMWTLKSQYQIPLIQLITFIILFFVFNILLTVFMNATIGKKIMKLRVRGEFDNFVSFEQVLYREAIIKPITTGLIFGLLYPFFDKEKKALHDHITKTCVVNQ